MKNLSEKEELSLRLTSTEYVERMVSLLIKLYSEPETFFTRAKLLYEQMYHSWLEGDKVSAVIQVFRHAYNAYAREERIKLVSRFAIFTDGIQYANKTKRRLYDAFALFANHKYSLSSLVKILIKKENFIDCINEHFQNAFCSLEYSQYQTLFIKDIETISPYLYDETYKVIGENLPYNYDHYDSVINELIKSGRSNLVSLFLSNKNCTVTMACLQSTLEYAQNHQDDVLRKIVLRTILRQEQVSFSLFFQYYQMLNEKEKETEHSFLERIATSNHFEKGYSIMIKDGQDENALKNLSIKEFISLSEIIKNQYVGVYLPYLISAINKSTKLLLDASNEVFECLQKYNEERKVLLQLPLVKELSYRSNRVRRLYLMWVKENDLLFENKISIY